MTFLSKLPVRFAIGLIAGAAIAYIDNYAFAGEVSPVIIIVMLLAATFTSGVIWGQRGWITAAAAWVCIPAAHFVKHILGLPDTLHPNTFTSILYLALFSLVVAAVGIGGGMLIHKLMIEGGEQRENYD